MVVMQENFDPVKCRLKMTRRDVEIVIMFVMTIMWLIRMMLFMFIMACKDVFGLMLFHAEPLCK